MNELVPFRKSNIVYLRLSNIGVKFALVVKREDVERRWVLIESEAEEGKLKSSLRWPMLAFIHRPCLNVHVQAVFAATNHGPNTCVFASCPSLGV